MHYTMALFKRVYSVKSNAFTFAEFLYFFCHSPVKLFDIKLFSGVGKELAPDIATRRKAFCSFHSCLLSSFFSVGAL